MEPSWKTVNVRTKQEIENGEAKTDPKHNSVVNEIKLLTKIKVYDF